MKDLIAGSLGRLDDAGGSSMFVVPRTIYVPPEYEVETDVPGVAEFVTCSLDGRLWIWRRSRRYYVAVFRWNDETQRLEFVSTTVLSGETVIRRGVDWILTDKSFILSSDNEPYISRTEYASDDTSYIDTINKSYSFFPELEMWQEINEQKIRVENSPNDIWQEIPQNKLTPFEFHYYSDDDIQTVTDFNPQICYCNGQLYAKGKAHIGRAYLLPYKFNTDNKITGFYLYISPDYMREYDSENQTFNDDDGWDKLNIAPLDDNSVGIFTPEDDNNTACKKAEDGLVYRLPQSEQLNYSVDNGVVFFDGFSGLNLVLNSQGVSFLRDNVSYQCRCLQQWLAPNNKIKAISYQQFVISSIENATIAIHTKQRFYRELLTNKQLPLAMKNYSDRTLSLSNGIKNTITTLQVNSIKNNSSFTQSCIWEQIYRQVLTYNVANVYFPKSPGFYDGAREGLLNNPFVYYGSTYGATVYSKSYYPFQKIYGNIAGFGDREICLYESGYQTWITYYSISNRKLETIYPNWDIPNYSIQIEKIEGSYPDSIHASRIIRGDIFVDNDDHCVKFVLEIETGNFFPREFTDYNNNTYITGLRYISGEEYSTSYVTVLGPKLPDELFDWIETEKCVLMDILETEKSLDVYFKIPLTNIPIKYVSLPPFAQYAVISAYTVRNYAKKNSFNGNIYTKSCHIYKPNSYVSRIFISEYHPEIFDFNTEVERSKLS